MLSFMYEFLTGRGGTRFPRLFVSFDKIFTCLFVSFDKISTCLFVSFDRVFV